MSSMIYIRKVVDELGELIKRAWTGADFNKLDDKFKSLRRRLIALEPIIGPLPSFLKSSETLWDTWHGIIKTNKLDTYESRREYLQENYTDFYDEIFKRITTKSFEQELLLRDLAIISEIGKGGFGVVYEAEHVVLQESRAIKKLDPIFSDAADEEKALRRFAREAQVLSQLTHANIVKFFDAGIANEHPFLVMEHIDGDNLQQIVAEEGTFDEAEAITVMRQILSAIAAAHSAGIVHRDLKPTNLMLERKRAVVLDFGAGQWLEKRLSTRLTTSVIGTTGYIADELFDDPTLKHPSIDCFSLGVVFHYLLTGRVPNTGEPTHFLEQKNISKELQLIIIKAISPMSKRYADGEKMLKAMDVL